MQTTQKTHSNSNSWFSFFYDHAQNISDTISSLFFKAVESGIKSAENAIDYVLKLSKDIPVYRDVSTVYDTEFWLIILEEQKQTLCYFAKSPQIKEKNQKRILRHLKTWIKGSLEGVIPLDLDYILTTLEPSITSLQDEEFKKRLLEEKIKLIEHLNTRILLQKEGPLCKKRSFSLHPAQAFLLFLVSFAQVAQANRSAIKQRFWNATIERDPKYLTDGFFNLNVYTLDQNLCSKTNSSGCMIPAWLFVGFNQPFDRLLWNKTCTQQNDTISWNADFTNNLYIESNMNIAGGNFSWTNTSVQNSAWETCNAMLSFFNSSFTWSYPGFAQFYTYKNVSLFFNNCSLNKTTFESISSDYLNLHIAHSKLEKAYFAWNINGGADRVMVSDSSLQEARIDAIWNSGEFLRSNISARINSALNNARFINSSSLFFNLAISPNLQTPPIFNSIEFYNITHLSLESSNKNIFKNWSLSQVENFKVNFSSIFLDQFTLRDVNMSGSWNQGGFSNTDSFFIGLGCKSKNSRPNAHNAQVRNMDFINVYSCCQDTANQVKHCLVSSGLLLKENVTFSRYKNIPFKALNITAIIGGSLIVITFIIYKIRKLKEAENEDQPLLINSI